MPNALEEVKTHLQFQGYEVSQDGEIAKAIHKSKANILLREFKGGLLFTALYGAADKARNDKTGFLELINYFNNQAAVVRFYADKDSDLFMESWYPSIYDRTEFSAFMERWDYDTSVVLTSKPEVSEYLK